MNSRRRFLLSTGLVTGTLLGASACEDSKNDSPRLSEAEKERALLDAMVDTYVPRDQDPGGVEAGVPDMLLQVFEKNHRLEAHSKTLMSRLNELARETHGRVFAELDIDDRESILTAIYRSRDKVNAPARDAVLWMRVEILNAFYLTPEGRAVLGYYPPYPIGYPDYAVPPEGNT